MRKLILTTASLMLLAGNVSATNIGYSKDVINRANTFRLGTGEKQGQAIRFSKAKLQALKGTTIDNVEFVLGSKNTNDNTMKVFLSTSLDGEPIAEGTLSVTKSLSKLKWTLDTPYTITGDEECLYVGFTAEAANTYKLLMFDASYDIEGCNYAIKDGEWVDTYGMDKGSALIFVNSANAPEYTDAIIGRSNFDGYYKKGDNCEFNACFVNEGTTTISSFDAVVKVGANTNTKHFDNLNIKPKEGYSFVLSDIDSSVEGEQNISVTISNVNGEGKEADTSDNGISANVFFYPEDMERALLVESFTGQDCSNCPKGHTTLNSVLEAAGRNVVEVTHHIGYQPDMFTMANEDAYRFFYQNPSSTSAPAVMVNRDACADISSAPVIYPDYNNTLILIYNAEAKKPYVSLSLETALDKSSRELNVKLHILPHTQLPSENSVLNVFLVQDGLNAYQSSGGTNYVHNRVFRGAVTGNSWGVKADNLTPGKTATWEKTITIPEKIHSDYWTDDMITEVKDASGNVTKRLYGNKYELDQTDIEAVLENMTVVAYVAEFDSDDNTKNVVYNCCEAKLGESYTQSGYKQATGVKSATDDAAPNIYVSGGKVHVGGNYDSLEVYNLAGAKVQNDNLVKGVYIAKLVAQGKLYTKKVLVK